MLEDVCALTVVRYERFVKTLHCIIGVGCARILQIRTFAVVPGTVDVISDDEKGSLGTFTC